MIPRRAYLLLSMLCGCAPQLQIDYEAMFTDPGPQQQGEVCCDSSAVTCKAGSYCDPTTLGSGPIFRVGKACIPGCTSNDNCAEGQTCHKSAKHGVGACGGPDAGPPREPDPCGQRTADDNYCAEAGLPSDGTLRHCDAGSDRPQDTECRRLEASSMLSGWWCCP